MVGVSTSALGRNDAPAKEWFEREGSNFGGQCWKGCLAVWRTYVLLMDRRGSSPGPCLVERNRGRCTFRLTQALTGHGCFGGYLHRVARGAASPLRQPRCGGQRGAHTFALHRLVGVCPGRRCSTSASPPSRKRKRRNEKGRAVPPSRHRSVVVEPEKDGGSAPGPKTK